MNENETNILNAAIAALRQEINVPVEAIQLENNLRHFQPDAVLRIHLPGKPVEFLIEIKTTVTEATVGQVIHRFEGDNAKWMLITRRVLPAVAKTLRELGVPFMDTVGNVYINEPPALIFLQTNKRPMDVHIDRRDEGMLGKAGLRLVFALLCKRELQNANYTTMANVAGVALGTAHGVLKDLMRRGYLVEFDAKLRKLARVEELVNKWTTAYAEKLRPKLFIGRYAAPRTEFWQDVDITRLDAQWGGEIAANRYTRFLQPEIITIYTTRPANNLVLALKLRKDNNGNVELRERFWKFENEGPDRNLVPPLLVYADLMATADARNIQAAKIMYDDYLPRHIK